MRSVLDVMFDPNSGVGVAERPRALIDRLAELWGIVSDVSNNLPPETLRWRIQNWLSVGQARVERGLRDMKVSLLCGTLPLYDGLGKRSLPAPSIRVAIMTTDHAGPL